MPFTNFPYGVTSFGVPVLPPFGNMYGNAWFVDTVDGNDSYSYGMARGKSMDKPYRTMAAALTAADAGDTIYFTGDIREQITGDNTKNNITIVGCGAPAHPWQGNGGIGVACWRAPASPTAATPLIAIRAQGWQFYNMLMAPPSDAAAVYLDRNADETPATDEYDSSHALIFNVRFDGGSISTNVGILNAAGSGFVQIYGCRFFRLQYGYRNSGTAVAVPLNMIIGGDGALQNVFQGNTNHIVGSFNNGQIVNNIIGQFTTTGISTAAVSGQGAQNVVTKNTLSGTYSNVGGYTASGTDSWMGNFADVSGGVTQSRPA